MPWPTAPVVTTGMDADTDALPRADILDLTTKFNELIAMRGVASGVCDLDGAGLVPAARIPAEIARLVSPAMTGTPTAPTAALRNSSIQLATTAFVLSNGLLNGSLPKSVAYTVVAADFGKLIDCTGTFTLALTAAATLGAGFAIGVRNSGTGTITIDPDGTELIDGAATIALVGGESCLVVCDGTAFRTVGKGAAPLPAATASVSGYMTSTYASKLDGIAAGANVGVALDAGVGGVGIIAMMQTDGGTSVASGATVAGANLSFSGHDGAGVIITLGGGVGTWRNITAGTILASFVGTFQRIA